MAADIEAHEAGVTDGPLPALGNAWEEWIEDDERIAGKLAWKELKPFVQDERKRLVMERRKRYFQTLLTQYLVNEWFKRNTSETDGAEIHRATDTLRTLLRDDCTHEAKLYLIDVLTSGKKFADNQLKKRRIGGWAWFSFTLTALRGLIYVAAVLAVFSVTHSPFEKVSIALVVIIGNMLLTNRASDELYRLRFGTTVDKHFNALRQSLKIAEDEIEREAREEPRFDSDKAAARSTITAIISFVFEGLVWLICVVELILAIW